MSSDTLSVQEQLDAVKSDDGIVRAADGTPLKARLAKALRREKQRSFLLIAPLLFFIVISFLIPIGDMLLRSVENQIVQNTLPTVVQELERFFMFTKDENQLVVHDPRERR